MRDTLWRFQRRPASRPAHCAGRGNADQVNGPSAAVVRDRKRRHGDRSHIYFNLFLDTNNAGNAPGMLSPCYFNKATRSPNDCVEARWGAPVESEETSTCNNARRMQVASPIHSMPNKNTPLARRNQSLKSSSLHDEVLFYSLHSIN